VIRTSSFFDQSIVGAHTKGLTPDRTPSRSCRRVID
jgi:hypothetical protein